MHRMTIPLALACLALVAGCGSAGAKGAIRTASTPSGAASTASVASTPAAAPSAAQSISASPTPTTSTVTEIGPAHYAQYAGLRVSVLSLTRYTPSATSTGLKSGDSGVKFQIRLTNDGTAQFDPTLTTIAVHAGANGDQGDEIVDLGSANITDSFTGAVPPGQSVTATFAYAVPSADLPGTVTVIVSPGLDYQDAPFSGNVS